MKSAADRIIAAAGKAPRVPHPARTADENALQAASRLIRDLAPSSKDLAEAERHLIEKAEAPPLGPVLAVKLARSQAAVSSLPASTTIWILFPMFRETARLKPAALHPSGENLLRNKIRQLESLFAGSTAGWKLTAVDDGCPDGSGRQAQKILVQSYPELIESGRASVLFLADAVESGRPEAEGIESAKASTKGGSLLFGLRTIRSFAAESDVIVYTDADLSTHLGQAGLLAGPIAGGGFDMMAGSRREPDSVQVRSSFRSHRGRLFIPLWKRILPVMPAIIDSQAGFKAFRAKSAGTILAEAREIGFALDLELLLLAHLKGLKVGKAGICWIDSESESATAGQDVHLSMLRSAAAMRRRHLSSDAPGGEIAAFIESLDRERWEEMVRHPPTALIEASLEDLGDPRLM